MREKQEIYKWGGGGVSLVQLKLKDLTLQKEKRERKRERTDDAFPPSHLHHVSPDYFREYIN